MKNELSMLAKLFMRGFFVGFLLILIPVFSWAKILPGADQFFSETNLKILKGKRVGVLAHHASRLQNGQHLVDALFANKDFTLNVIFAPEHGFRSTQDQDVPDTKDPVTGLPVISLYGPRRAPTPEQLNEIDTIVVDLQDVGVRFYTYAATVAHVLRACKVEKKAVVLLDRPNPLGGQVFEGPLLEKEFYGGITSYYPTTMRHGMTLGELARLFNEKLKIHADLTIVPVSGLGRTTAWDEHELAWYAPSPALPSLEQAQLYGIFGAFESLNLAVGRSTDNKNAFRWYGAPWISKKEAKALAKALDKLNLPGLEFKEAEWVAGRREYHGRRCHGFAVQITRFDRVEGFRSFVEVLSTLRRFFKSRVVLAGIDRGVGKHWLRKAIESGQSTKKILEKAKKEAESFSADRESVLLY